ncbi:uncharacterized protein LOC118195996 [Stegodyphus dumicola]|uniref:uncharacterized protein LOC118195996 n=1 Tax=Stegodyphus dumicola TaxID=202533 RepID=UPI0015ACC34D|nr:uncharacterized protein LOC118195996 [Stegodyphus dumicola]
MRIQWIFNSLKAAWWGGWWERIVQMIKNLLRRLLGKASLKYEEMYTVLYDTEVVINCRPLTYLFEDAQDLMPLTPSMLLQDNKTIRVPDLDNLDNINLTKRYRHQQKLWQELRRRIRKEYLGLLIQQNINKNSLKQISVGEVVLVGCDNKKRIFWPLVIVTELFPGKNNHVRVVKVQTEVGELIRPVQRLYPFEITNLNILLRAKELERNFEPTVSHKVKPSRYK